MKLDGALNDAECRANFLIALALGVAKDLMIQAGRGIILKG